MKSTRSGVSAVGLLALFVLLGGFAALASSGYDGRSLPMPFREPQDTGGVARVGVSTTPDPADKGQGGVAYRSLTSARLFVRDAEGIWRANAVVPGSDRGRRGLRRVEFRLRADAMWSDGTPLRVDDLIRTMDRDRVERLESQDGLVRVWLKFPDPEWRSLWSDDDGIQPPREGLSGGPFVPGSRGQDGHLTFTRNSNGWGGKALLDSVELVPVPDVETQRQLMAMGELDVVAPVPDTERRRLWSEVGVITLADGGARRVIRFGSGGREDEQRWLLQRWSTVPFASSFLVGEVVGADGGAAGGAWTRQLVGTQVRPLGKSVTLWVDALDPLGSLLGTTLKNIVGGEGVRVEVREYFGSPPALEGLSAAVVTESPSGRAATRSAQALGGVGMRDAGSRDGGLSGGGSLSLEMWRDRHALVVSSRIGGTEVNAYQTSALWNAGDWYLRG